MHIFKSYFWSVNRFSTLTCQTQEELVRECIENICLHKTSCFFSDDKTLAMSASLLPNLLVLENRQSTSLGLCWLKSAHSNRINNACICVLCALLAPHTNSCLVLLGVHTYPFNFALSFLSHGTRMKLRNISTTCKAANKVTCSCCIHQHVCVLLQWLQLFAWIAVSKLHMWRNYLLLWFDRPLVALLLILLACCQFWSDKVADKLLKQAYWMKFTVILYYKVIY